MSQLGLTAERIAELIGCSLRTVRVVKADPLTAVMTTFQQEVGVFADEVRLLRSELTRMTAEHAAATESASRLRKHLVRVTSPVPVCSNGHELSRYNRYEHKGRTFCRECHRGRQAAHRARKKVSP